MNEHQHLGEAVIRYRDNAVRVTELRKKLEEWAEDLQQITFALKDWSRSRPDTSGPSSIAFTTSTRTGGRRAEFDTSFGQELYDDLTSLYTTFEDSCGVVPNTLSRELLPTFQTEIDVCWHIASLDADTLMMVWGEFASRVEDAVWFALS